MVWSWSSSHKGRVAVVDCHFCANKLDLVTLTANYDDPRGKGKGRAITHDRPVAMGTLQDWICGYCACRNHLDQNGFFISDEPAHHDAQLNLESFSRRGQLFLAAALPRNHLRPRSTRMVKTPIAHALPHVYDAATPTKTRITSSTPEKQNPFCRSCLSNQSLQIHLLASYDLDSDPPVATTSSSPASMSIYRQSLDRRYPIVCSTCLPSVQAIIKQRDYRTKTSLLASRLRESQRAAFRKGDDQSTDGTSLWTVLVWRLRGVLWYSTWITCIIANAWAMLDPTWSNRQCPLPVVFVLASSLLWTNWDPTWLQLHRPNALKRRRLRTQGRRMYISIQMLAYTHRLGLGLFHHLKPASIVPHTYSVSLTVQVLLLTLSFYAIRLVPRAQVRIGPSRPVILPTSPAATTTADPLEPIENLSISSDMPTLLPSSTKNSSHHTNSTPNSKLTSKSSNLSTSLLFHRQNFNPEPKFGEPWIQVSPTSIQLHLNDQDGDIEMSDAETEPVPKGKGRYTQGFIEFGKSKVRWGWNEPSSGLDEVFEERMRVDDDLSLNGNGNGNGQTQERGDKNGEGGWKWLRWFGG